MWCALLCQHAYCKLVTACMMLQVYGMDAKSLRYSNTIRSCNSTLCKIIRQEAIPNITGTTLNSRRGSRRLAIARQPTDTI